MSMNSSRERMVSVLATFNSGEAVVHE